MPEPQRYQLSLPAPVPEWGIDASGKEPGPAIGRLLMIALQRVVPEAMEPRKIATGGGATAPGRPDAPAGEVAHAA